MTGLIKWLLRTIREPKTYVGLALVATMMGFPDAAAFINDIAGIPPQVSVDAASIEGVEVITATPSSSVGDIFTSIVTVLGGALIGHISDAVK